MEQQNETVYSIGEAADLLGVSVPTLRLYEREGLILPPRKKSGHRLFREQDLDRIRSLRKTISGKRASIAGIKQLLSHIPCWTIKSCPDELRVHCKGFTDNDSACWTIPEREWECRTADCRECSVYAQHSGCLLIGRAAAQQKTAPDLS